MPLNAVAAALGFLPLALAHAGAYCAARTGVPFGEYLELLERLPSQDMFDTNPETFYQHTVAATWNTSIAAAARQAPLARPALEMTAYLAAEAIPRSFFLGLAEDNSAAGRKQMAATLAALDRYSLATVADNTVSVHRLLQKVIRDRLAGNGHADQRSTRLRQSHVAMPGDPQQPATWPQWQELVPHGIALADNQPAAEHDAAKLMAILNPMCLFLLSAGFPQQSLDLATRAVAVSASHLDADDINTLTARGAQVSSLQAAGRSSGAIALGEPLVSDFERVLGPSHPDTLIAKEDLARAYLAAGRQGEALALQKQVVAGRQAIFGASHPDTLRAQSNLATAYQAAGQTDTAIAVLRRVLAERQRAPGSQPPRHPGHSGFAGPVLQRHRACRRGHHDLGEGRHRLRRGSGARTPRYPLRSRQPRRLIRGSGEDQRGYRPPGAARCRLHPGARSRASLHLDRPR